jgi:hypothetical protein
MPQCRPFRRPPKQNPPNEAIFPYSPHKTHQLCLSKTNPNQPPPPHLASDTTFRHHQYQPLGVLRRLTICWIPP